jgi:hypothetical protein
MKYPTWAPDLIHRAYSGRDETLPAEREEHNG